MVNKLAWGRELVIIPSIIIETCCFSGFLPSNPSFFINQPMGIWDMTISFGNFNGSDAKLDVQENPLVESWKGFFPTCQVRVVRFYVSWSALLRTSGPKCSPPDLKHKEFLKIYQVECQIECQKICQTNVTW